MDPLTIGAVAKGIGSVLSIFGGRKKKPEKIDLVGLRDEALRAGFNPAFALSATGGAGFRSGGGLSSLETLGGAIGSIGETFQALDPVLRETRELELELLREELEQAKQRAAMASSFGGGFGEAPAVRTTRASPAKVQINAPLSDDPNPPEASDFEPTIRVQLKNGEWVDVPNPEMPVELETDYFRAWKEGELVETIEADLERNFPGFNQSVTEFLELFPTTPEYQRKAERERVQRIDRFERDRMIREAERKRFDPFQGDAYYRLFN